MPYSPMLNTENLAYLNDLRGRVLRNEHVEHAELQEALKLLAEGRMQAQIAGTAKKSKRSSIAVPDGSSLLANMAAKLKGPDA